MYKFAFEGKINRVIINGVDKPGHYHIKKD